MTRLEPTSVTSRVTSRWNSTVLALVLQLGVSVASDWTTVDTVACPHCGQGVPYPQRTGEGELTLAECDECDIFFDVPALEQRRRRVPTR